MKKHSMMSRKVLKKELEVERVGTEEVDDDEDDDDEEEEEEEDDKEESKCTEEGDGNGREEGKKKQTRPPKKKLNIVWTPEMVLASTEKKKRKLESYIPTLRELEKTETFDKAADRNMLLNINMSYFSFASCPLHLRQTYRQQMADFLLNSELFSLLSSIFRSSCNKGLPVSFMKELKPDLALVRPTKSSISVFFNYCDTSEAMCSAVAKDHLLLTVLSALQQLKDDHFEGKLHAYVTKLLRIFIALPYNLVRRNDSEIIDKMHEIGMVQTIRPYLQSKTKNIKADALLFIIFVVSEEEAREFCSDANTFTFLLDNLRMARRSRKKVSAKGYSNIELLRALEKLSALDVNKQLLGECQVLHEMLAILEEGDAEEMPLALRIATQLAFDQENANWIQEKMSPLLESKFPPTCEDAELRTCADQLRWVVHEHAVPNDTSDPVAQDGMRKMQDSFKKQKKKMFFRKKADKDEKFALQLPAAKDDQDQHVMISYQWGVQDQVVEITKALQNNNIKVWLDLNDMGSNTLDSMAIAVEKAWAVIIAVSRKYKDSTNTRLEAEYAHRKSKLLVPLMMEKWRPDGWLGLLVGSKLYFDFSGKYPFDVKIGELLKSLEALRKGGEEEIPIVSDSVSATEVPPPPPLREVVKKNFDFLDSWDQEKVRSWCRQSNIDTLYCRSITGRELRFLLRLRGEAPEFFYRTLESKLKVTSLADLVTFVEALDRLG